MIASEAHARSTPDLSVVVFLFTSRAHLIRCLETLAAQETAASFEVLLPYDNALDRPDELRARFPDVRFLPLSGRRTPAELRAAAVLASSASVVAFVEDHCMPVPDWCARILEMHRTSHAAVGGSVEKGFPPGRTTDTALNWAIYMADYSRYMRPIPAGPAHGLTDCNVSYKRSELDAIEDAWRVELHENIVNGLLAERGRTLWLDPDIIVHEQRHLTLRSAWRDRVSFGRLFGSTRVAGVPTSRRFVMAAAALAMPPLLVLRVAQNLFSRGRHRAQFFRCLPALVFVSSAWMLGESIGYLTGTPGSLAAAPASGSQRADAATATMPPAAR